MTIEDEYNIWLKVVKNIEPYNSLKNLEHRLEHRVNNCFSKKKHKINKASKSKKKTESCLKRRRDDKSNIGCWLDLHGMTQAAAFNVLNDFIPMSFSRGERKILIITGKGSNSEGVLKKMLPLWLEGNIFKKYIDHIGQSELKDGGEGAFYIYLKREVK